MGELRIREDEGEEEEVGRGPLRSAIGCLRAAAAAFVRNWLAWPALSAYSNGSPMMYLNPLGDLLTPTGRT